MYEDRGEHLCSPLFLVVKDHIHDKYSLEFFVFVNNLISQLVNKKSHRNKINLQ